MLPPLLHENHIILHLEAPNRETALIEMMAQLPQSEFASKKKVQAIELILQRERFGTTASGDGVAFPHCSIPDITEPVVALGISRKGVDYCALDGAPVFFLLMIIFPESYQGTQAYLDLLREAALIFRDRFLKERLKISQTREEAYEIFSREAGHLIQRPSLRTSA